MHDYRLNPFTGNMETVEMVDFHIVPKNQPHYIRLRDIPEKGDPVTTVTVRPFVFVTDATIAIGATVINVDFDLSTPFKEGQIITINEEKMQIKTIEAGKVTVSRGYGGTIATEHSRPSATEPIIAYGPPFAEVPKEPGQGQYQPDYHTSPGDDGSWNTGTLRFNPADAMTWVQVKYNSIGSLASAERTNHDPLRNYPYLTTQSVIVVLSGTSSLGPYLESQIIYVRKGAQLLSAAAPGLLLKASGATVVAGVVNSADRGAYTRYLGLGAFGSFPFHEPSNGGGGGSLGIAYGDNVVYGGAVTVPLEQRLMFARKNIVCYGGSANGNRAGGGTTVISPYIYLTNSAIFHNQSGNGGGGCTIFSGELIVDEKATCNVGGIGAGWVLKNEYGGRC